MVAFGVALMIGLIMMTRGGFVPFFIIFFVVGPWLLRAFAHESRWNCATEPQKRKNDPFEKSKNDQFADPVGYLMTDDGEVMEIIDEPDRASRRDDGFI